MQTRRLTMGQAIVEYLRQQHVERDGVEQSFYAGMFGIFGHGNVAGIGQALHQYADSFRYYQTRNEQAMVHTSAAFAKMNNRLRTLACTTSIGPGATNMLTAAAGATINRLPVLLLPGDIFANRYCNSWNHHFRKIFPSMTASNRFRSTGIESIDQNRLSLLYLKL